MFVILYEIVIIQDKCTWKEEIYIRKHNLDNYIIIWSGGFYYKNH